jgi:arylsulfatase A-like enzyme
MNNNNQNKAGSKINKILGLFVISLSGLMIATSANAARQDQPNVLFIAIDDLRPELGAYGASHIKTPNIDALAQEGLMFKRAYAQVPTCGASRASMMTGMLPSQKRFITYTTRADVDVPNARTLPQVFKEAGYTTVSIGKVFHTLEDSQDRSWSKAAWRPEVDHFKSFDPATSNKSSGSKHGRVYEAPGVSDDSYVDGQIAQKAIDELSLLKEKAEPFFLAVGFYRPHMPFYAPKKYWDLYDRDTIELADNQFRPEGAPASLKGSNEYKQYSHGTYKIGTPEWQRMMRHGYYASVSYVDKLVGDVLTELDRHGLSDNTIIVLWGDHGWHLGEHSFWGKHNTLDKSLRVPLIIRVPGGVKGEKTTALVESVDIYPTLADLAGLSTPSTVQGESFKKLFSNPQLKFRDFTYSRFRNADTVISKTHTYTFYKYKDGGEMLYDLERDSEENINVAQDPAYADTLKAMKAMLKKRLKAAVNVEQ